MPFVVAGSAERGDSDINDQVVLFVDFFRFKLIE